MRFLSRIMHNNRLWATEIAARDPDYFERLARGQAPPYFWVGCADSRVPPSDVAGLGPGELFVYRNIANQLRPDDLAGEAALRYAVDVLGVGDVIICGHHGCGGVRAAVADTARALPEVHLWLEGLRELGRKHAAELDALPDPHARADRLCELNVREQVLSACRSAAVRGAWASGKELSVHGWLYGLKDGLLVDLGLCVSSAEEASELEAESG